MYSGAAPAAMGQMGAGLAEVGANIARSHQRGGELMGQGIAKGIESAGEAYEDYKKMSSQVKADSAAFDTLKDYMPKDVAESFDMQRRAMETDPSTSLQDRASFYNSAKSFLGTSIQHRMDMDKLDAQLQVTKGIGLGNILAPYVMGQKGAPVNPSTFLAPGFDNQPTQPSVGQPALQGEMEAFKAERPNGTPEEFPIWQEERARIRAARAKSANSSPDFLALPR